MVSETIPVSAQLSKESLDALTALAALRGLDANTVLAQAISTEKLLSDNVAPGDEVLIRKGNNNFSKVVFGSK